MTDHNVLVGTPAYNGHVHLDYLESVQSFHRAGIRFSLATTATESLITRARNEIVARFVEAAEFTHLLFLDADVRLEGVDLRRMLEHGKDVIGARVPLKHLGEGGERTYNVGKTLAEVSKLEIVTRVGTAALMLSRAAVASLASHCRSSGKVYRRNRVGRKSEDEPLQYDVFRVGVFAGEYLSEDFWVCYQLRELGYPVYVDPEIVTHHNGSFRF